MRLSLPKIRVEDHVSTVGMLFGTLLFALSLTPSLLPREDVVQGVISGLCMAAGYAVGALGVGLWRFLELPAPRQRVQHIVYIVAAVLCALLVITFLWQASSWNGPSSPWRSSCGWVASNVRCW
jgi:uncharacterized membrane protein